MPEKHFYLALKGESKDADVEDAMWKLADWLTGGTGGGTIYVEDLRDLEPFVTENRFMDIGSRIEKIRRERQEQPRYGFRRYDFWILGRAEEQELEDQFRKEYGALPVYELTIRKIGFMDDGEKVKFRGVEEERESK